ncbi:CvpA family protein [Helicobacter mehlei]|uniref:CvpA family protein n=1 Tax=Helicobacter mehlei TaxID=2316080 RepID=A0A553V2M3_9HELI|nr:CvpA family protein [Helicobacter mehlei]TSA86644.1 CvpA family protein [Helicobacter mehlei]
MAYYFDVTLAVLILLIGIRGFYKGLIDEVAGLLGIVAGVYLASRFAGVAGEWFSGHIYHIPNDSLATLIGFVIVLASIWIAFLILGVFVSKLVNLSGLGIIDRVLGFIFSCAKMFLVFAFLVYGLSRLSAMKDVDQYLRTHSQIYPYMQEVASHIMQLQGVRELSKVIQPKSSTGKPADKPADKPQEPPTPPQEKINL